MGRILDFYTNGEYFKNNPTWDSADTDWKFGRFADVVKTHLPPANGVVWEVGCGSAALLKRLALRLPNHDFLGWDISPDAERFWPKDCSNLKLEVGDVLQKSPQRPADLVMLIDVLEHLADPITFLENLRPHTKSIVVHLPLDMTMINVLLDFRLVNLRNSIGHIHYFTKALAEKMVQEAGYEVTLSQFSQAWKDSPNLTWKGRIGRIFRRVLSAISPDLNAKLLGGETLILVARRVPGPVSCHKMS